MKRVILLLPMMLMACSQPAPPPAPTTCTSWEYEVKHALPATRPARGYRTGGAVTGGENEARLSAEEMGKGPAATTSITPAKADLNKMGAEGWELVSTYLETETAYPMMTNSRFEVRAINPNVRPQRVVMLFKRCSKN